MEVQVCGLEAKSSLGWECPKCRTVHAPFISVCSHCDANKYPRLQAWLLNDMKKRLDDKQHTHFILTRSELEKLLTAAGPQL